MSKVYSISPTKALLFVRTARRGIKFQAAPPSLSWWRWSASKVDWKVLWQTYEPECSEWNATNHHGSKCAMWYSKWHSWIWILQYHGWWEHWCEQHWTTCNFHILSGQGDDSTSQSDKCQFNFHLLQRLLLRMNLRIPDAHGQCYDGCPSITGTKMGLMHKSRKKMENVCWCTANATHLILCWGYNKKENGKCLLMHSEGHSLNLVLGIH